MDSLKREIDSKDGELISKKVKIGDVSDDGVGERKTLGSDIPLSGEKKSGSIEKDQTSGNNLKHNDTDESAKLNSSSKQTCPAKPEAAESRLGKFSLIEADAAEDKGSRHSMEDAWVVLLDASLEFPGSLRCAHFAIYDGHGGRMAAEYAQKNLHLNVLNAGLPRELMNVKAAKKAVIEGFRKTDESLLLESAAGGWQDGATAVCLWVLGQSVLVANIGDAKAVVARASQSNEATSHPDEKSPLKAIVVTREHKAIYPQERVRIQKAGGHVGPNGRLQGRLEVSRAFGDLQFKKVGVIATPDVHSFEVTERDHFIILGCDGLWGVFGPSDAVEFVHKHLQDGLSATYVARRLVREAVRERRCKDNCTAVVIVFKHG